MGPTNSCRPRSFPVKLHVREPQSMRLPAARQLHRREVRRLPKITHVKLLRQVRLHLQNSLRSTGRDEDVVHAHNEVDPLLVDHSQKECRIRQGRNEHGTSLGYILTEDVPYAFDVKDEVRRANILDSKSAIARFSVRISKAAGVSTFKVRPPKSRNSKVSNACRPTGRTLSYMHQCTSLDSSLTMSSEARSCFGGFTILLKSATGVRSRNCGGTLHDSLHHTAVLVKYECLYDIVTRTRKSRAVPCALRCN